jgi:signal recognition particle receptor subunit beta
MGEFDIDVDVIGGNVTGQGPGVDKWWAWMAERI